MPSDVIVHCTEIVYENFDFVAPLIHVQNETTNRPFEIHKIVVILKKVRKDG